MTAAHAPKEDMRTLLERMPWRGKFTKAETAIFETRRAQLMDAMTDAVGIFGQTMYTDPAHLQLLAVHVAMAGDFFNDGHGRFIEYRIRERVSSDDGVVLFEGVREWRKCGEFGDSTEQPPADGDDRLAEAALTQIKQQLSPKVRQKLLAAMRDEFAAATNDDDEESDNDGAR